MQLFDSSIARPTVHDKGTSAPPADAAKMKGQRFEPDRFDDFCCVLRTERPTKGQSKAGLTWKHSEADGSNLGPTLVPTHIAARAGHEGTLAGEFAEIQDHAFFDRAGFLVIPPSAAEKTAHSSGPPYPDFPKSLGTGSPGKLCLQSWANTAVASLRSFSALREFPPAKATSASSSFFCARKRAAR